MGGRTHPTLAGNNGTLFLDESKLEIAPLLFPSLDSDKAKHTHLLGGCPGTWVTRLPTPVAPWVTDTPSGAHSELCSDVRHSQLEGLSCAELWGPCSYSCFHHRLPWDSPRENRPPTLLKNKQPLLVLQNNYLQKGTRQPIHCQL